MVLELIPDSLCVAQRNCSGILTQYECKWPGASKAHWHSSSYSQFAVCM